MSIKTKEKAALSSLLSLILQDSLYEISYGTLQAIQDAKQKVIAMRVLIDDLHSLHSSKRNSTTFVHNANEKK